MPRSQVPGVQLERLPHRHAVIRLRRAYRRLRQLEVAPKADLEKPGVKVQEVTRCNQ